MLTTVRFRPGILLDDPPYSTDGFWVDGDMVRFRLGEPESIGGWEKYHPSAVEGKARQIYEWFTNVGAAWVGIGTHTKLYVLGGGELHDITPADLAAGYEFSITSDGWGSSAWGENSWGDSGTVLDNQARIWALANWGEWLLASPRGGTIYQWELDTSSPAAPVANAPERVGQIVVTPEGFCIALGATEGTGSTYIPTLVRWCSQRDLEDWSPSALDLAGDQQLQFGSMIVGGISTKLGTLIWSDTSLLVMRYLGDAEFVFSFELLGNECGLIGPNAAVERDGNAFWMTPAGTFYSYEGGAPRPMVCPFQSLIRDNLVAVQADLVYAAINPVFNEILFFLPMGPDYEISRVIAFNYAESVWYTWTLARTCWTDGGRIGNPIAVAPDGMIYRHEVGTDADGAALESFITSWPFEFASSRDGDGDRTFNILRCAPDIKATGPVDVTLITRRWMQDAVEHSKTRTYTPSTTKLDLRVQGRQAQLRVKSNTVGTRWRLAKCRFDIVPAGRR